MPSHLPVKSWHPATLMCLGDVGRCGHPVPLVLTEPKLEVKRGRSGKLAFQSALFSASQPRTRAANGTAGAGGREARRESRGVSTSRRDAAANRPGRQVRPSETFGPLAERGTASRGLMGTGRREARRESKGVSASQRDATANRPSRGGPQWEPF